MKTTLLTMILVVLQCHFASAQNLPTSKRNSKTERTSAYRTNSYEYNDRQRYDNDDRKIYKENGISISFNKDWKVKEDKSKTTFIKAKSPKEHKRDALQEFVHVAKRKAGKMTLASYSSTYLKSLSEAKAYKNFRLISNKTVVINGIEWQQIVHKANITSKNIGIVNEIYLCVGGRARYSITCCSQENSYDRYKREFQKIIKSVKIR